MTPLFACFPVCLFFVALGFVALVVVASGMANRIPGDDQPGPAGRPWSPPGQTGPPPWWAIALMAAALIAFLLALARDAYLYE
jgi:hypothetical protein